MKPRPNLFLAEPMRVAGPGMAGVPNFLWHAYELALARCDRPDRDRIRLDADIFHPHAGMFAYGQQVENLFAIIPRERR